MHPKDKISDAWTEFIGDVTATMMRASDEELLDIYSGTTLLGKMPDHVAAHVRTYAWLEISYRRHIDAQDPPPPPHLLCFQHQKPLALCRRQHANTGAKT